MDKAWTTPPAAVPSIRGDQFQCRRGASCRKGAVSDGARHRRNIALFIRRLLVVPDAPRCMDSKGRCLFGRLVADGGGCRRGSQSLARGTLGSTGSGTVDKAWATPSAACRCRCCVPRTHEARTHEDGTSPDSKASRPRAAARRTSPFSCGDGRTGTWTTAVLWAGPRRARRKRWKRAMFRCWAAQIQASPHRH